MLIFNSNPTIDRNTLYGGDIGIFMWDSDPALNTNIFERVTNYLVNAPNSSTMPMTVPSSPGLPGFLGMIASAAIPAAVSV